MNRPARDQLPQLPQLHASSPLGAWLTRHLFKVVAALLLLLALLLSWIFSAYGFEIGLEGLTRTELALHGTIQISPSQDHSNVRRQISSLPSELLPSRSKGDSR